MTNLQRFLKDSTVQAMKKQGVKGTFTFIFTIEFFEEQCIVIGSTKINEKTFKVSSEMKKYLLKHIHDETDEFTIEVANEE